MVASTEKADPRRKLPPLPADPVGARFCNFFNHPWNFIVAPVPAAGEKTQWTTENRYPLQPRNLWVMYNDPDRLVGLRFGRETRYALIDIDIDSPYHPERNSKNFRAVIGAAEQIGLCRNMLVRSSESGGLHVYFFLPDPVSTFGIACAIKFALLDEGLQLGSGQLEIFPNVKAYSKNKPTNYNAHRLPLQVGSYLLDSECQPVTNNISLFLDWADQDATHQDMEELKEAIAAAVSRQKLLYVPDKTSKAEQWKRHLETRIREGWTGPGQTNELLKDIGTYGVVWLAKSGQQLTNYIEQTATNAPGYQQYCAHQHEIRRRAREWAVAVESFYSPYCSHPERSRTYSETFNQQASAGLANNIVPFGNATNEQRREKAQERVKNAVKHLKLKSLLSAAATARAKIIVATIKELFGVTVSHKTLYKKNYLPLWHPKFDNEGCGINEPEQERGDSMESNTATLVTSVEVIETLESLRTEDSKEIPTPPSYMKVCDLLSVPDALDGHLGAADFKKAQRGEEGNIFPTSFVTGIDLVEINPVTGTQQVNALETKNVLDLPNALETQNTLDLPNALETQNALETREVNVLPESTQLTPELPLEPIKDFWRVNHLRGELNALAQQEAEQQALNSGAAGRFLSAQERKALQTRKRMQLYWESRELALMEEAQKWAEEADKWPEVESNKQAPEEYSQLPNYLTDDEYHPHS